MELVQLRKSPDLVQQAREWLSMPIGVMMMQMLKDEHVHRYHRAVRGGEDAAMELGRIYGYDNAIANMLMAAVPYEETHKGPLEADWGIPGDATTTTQ